jgi:type IV fimbrial biogenesis protein FimT
MLALAFARSEAVKQGVSIAVIPATNASTGWSEGWCVGPTPAMSNCEDNDVLRVFDAAKGVNITGSYLQSGATALTFARNGSCPNCNDITTAQRFSITSPQLNATATDARCIRINPQGRATLSSKTRDAAC